MDDENFQPVRLQPPPQDILPVRLHGLEKSLPLYLHLLKAPALMAPQLPNIEPQIHLLINFSPSIAAMTT